MENFWRDKKVLVTGGTGFLGRYLTKKLIEQDAIVKVIDFRKPTQDFPAIDFARTDIRDKDRIGSLCKNVDIVFHLASIPSIAREKWDIYYSINVEGTRNILEAAYTNKIKKFVHVSSSTVYGVPREFPLKESSPVHPLGKYGRSKLMAEELCREFAKKGLNVSIIRPRVIIGPGRIGIFSILFERIRNHKPVYIIGNGSNVFQFTNVFDMVSACLRAAEYEKSDLFNIGSEEILTVREEIARLISYAASKSKIIGMPQTLAKIALKTLSLLMLSPLVNEQFMIADKNFKLDTCLARKQLNWTPQYSNVESLIQAYQWYISNIADGRAKQFRNMLGIIGKFKHSKMGGFQE